MSAGEIVGIAATITGIISTLGLLFLRYKKETKKKDVADSRRIEAETLRINAEAEYTISKAWERIAKRLEHDLEDCERREKMSKEKIN